MRVSFKKCNKIQESPFLLNLSNPLNKMKFFLIEIIKFARLGKVIHRNYSNNNNSNNNYNKINFLP